MKPNRREFIFFPAAAATAAPRIRIDPGLDGAAGRLSRKVHLDFHNSGHIAGIGAEFDHHAAPPGLGVFGFPLGASYHNQGYWVYRNAFRHVLDALLSRRLITANAPLSAEIAVTHQSARAGRPERYRVHVVNYSPPRRVPVHEIIAFEVS